MIFVLDNYDSFTYNLVQYFQTLGQEVVVRRNDECTLADIDALQPDFLCLSPGPGRPEQAGLMEECLHHFAGRIPILGICLGHQAIAHAYGGQVVPAQQMMHGKIAPVIHQQEGIFAGIPTPFQAMRYHSLAVDGQRLPDCLRIIAQDEQGEIMALAHREHPIYGLQFHPESIFSEHGHSLLHNFLNLQETT